MRINSLIQNKVYFSGRHSSVLDKKSEPKNGMPAESDNLLPDFRPIYYVHAFSKMPEPVYDDVLNNIEDAKSLYLKI